MAWEPVTAGLNAFTALVERILGPLLNESQAQGWLRERDEAAANWADALRTRSPDRIRLSVGWLLSRAGHPVGDLGGEAIEIPVEHLDALCRAAIDARANTQQLAAMTAALQKAKTP